MGYGILFSEKELEHISIALSNRLWILRNVEHCDRERQDLSVLKNRIDGLLYKAA